MHEKIEKAKKVAKQGERLINKMAYEQAMGKFDEAINIYQSSDIAWYNKGIVYLAQTKYAEAAYCFEKVVVAFPLYRARAVQKINLIRQEAQVMTQIEKDYYATSNDKLYRNDYCTKQYQDEVYDLQTRHREMKHWAYAEKINWIITLAEFCFKYYDPDKKVPIFADQTLLASTPEAKTKRLKIIGNNSAKYVIQRINPPIISAAIEEFSQSVLQNLGDDIFLDDSRMIFRMIFEAIHQLPREKRGELLDCLPWGSNSWYLIEFCSTFFHDTVSDTSIPFMYFPDMKEVSINQLRQFQQALQIDSCLVKVVLADLIKHDLPKLHVFFRSIQANINDPVTNSIAHLEELPNLRSLLWYFKHTYQFGRLSALLPTSLNTKTIVSHLDGDKTVERSPMVNLLLLGHTESTLVSTVKSKLAFIRRIQAVGEIFTRRGWGTYLDGIDYIDFELLQDIRNGLSHIEDLHAVDYIDELEHDDDKLISLYKEFSKFKDAIYGVIAKRQEKFTPLPDVDVVPFAIWKGPMEVYWNSVKLQYKKPQQFNLNDFIPSTPLLPAIELSKFLEAINKAAPVYNRVVSMVNGQTPMQQLSAEDLNDLVTPNIKPKKIKSTLKAATKKYQQLRKAEVQQKAVDKRAEEQQLTTTRRELMRNEYPAIRALGCSSIQMLHSPEKMSVRSLVDCLKSRFILLKKVFLEAGLDYDGLLELPSADLAKLCVTGDIELLMSCSYLISQIVGIMNKLDTLDLLGKIHSDLPDRLPSYIALRNALEHNDPVIDSKDNGFIQMQSNTSILMAQIIDELIVTFFTVVVKADAVDLVDFPDQFITTNDALRSKQALPIDCTTVDYPPLAVLKISNYTNGFSDLFFNTADSNEVLSTGSTNSLDSDDDSVSVLLSSNK